MTATRIVARAVAPRRPQRRALELAGGTVGAGAVAVLLKLSGWDIVPAVVLGLVAAASAIRVTRYRRPITRAAALSFSSIRAAPVAALVTATRWVVGGGLLWVALGMLLQPRWGGTLYSASATSQWAPELVCLYAAGALLLAPAALRLSRRLAARIDHLSASRRRILIAAGAVVLLAVQCALLWGVAKTPGFDAGGIVTSAWNAAHPGNDLNYGVVDGTGYYAMLPNNLFLGYLDFAIFGLLGALGLGAYTTALWTTLLLNAFVLSATVAIGFAAIRRTVGTRIAVLSLPGWLVLLGVSPWLNTAYSDTLGAIFPVLALYLVARLSEADSRVSRAICWVSLGVCAAVGSAMKPTTVLVFVPLVLLLIHRSRRTGAPWRMVLRPFALFAAVAVAVHFGTLAVVAASGFVRFDVFNDTAAMPFTHFMLMGVHGTGGYDGQDYINSTAIPSPTARFRFNLTEWWHTVLAMGPFGYSDFLAQKLFWMLGDGSFFQGREGDAFLEYLHNDPYSLAVRSVFVLGQPKHSLLSSLWQMCWFACLVGAGLSVALRDRRRGAVGWLTVLRASILLLMLFLLISEGRSRYVYLYVPFFVALAAAGFVELERSWVTHRSAVTRFLLRQRSLTAR